MEAAGVIALPEPCLVVLIGAAGAGKSTLAARLFPPEAILSSDAFRAVVAGDEADQGATRTAFAILHRQLERRLAAGRTTVVDATSVTPFARRGLVRRAAALGIPAVAIVLDLDPALVRGRNAARAGRVVPDAAVVRQLADLGRSLRPGVLEGEGFAAIHHVRSADELDRLALAP
jgi:predicted kinase